MKAPKRLVWSEGMFMSPHHLQQLDSYHEKLLSARIGGFAAYSWGVVDLKVSTPSLAAGQFQLETF